MAGNPLTRNEVMIPPPGIQKDKTAYSSPYCTDGVRTRFYQGTPMSMGGEVTLDLGNETIIRSMFNTIVSNGTNVYLGRKNSLKYIPIDSNGIATSPVDRTPTAFVSNDDVQWNFAQGTVTSTLHPEVFPAGPSYVIASPVQTANNYIGQNPVAVYAGPIEETTPLQPLSLNEDGDGAICYAGVAVVPPLLILLGKAGAITYSFPGMIDNFTPNADGSGSDLNSAYIGTSELLKCYSAPGSSGTTGLFWSVDQVIRADWSNSDALPAGIWRTNTLASNCGPLSSNAVVPYNQEFYWVGGNQFFRYNGVVQPIPNNLNSLFFFQNLNLNNRSKVWGVANPQYNEVTFFAPMGPDGSEVNHSVTYNVLDNTFYDSPFTKSAGIAPSSSYPYPVWTESVSVPVILSSGMKHLYPVWQQEIDHDRVIKVNNQTYTLPLEKSITFPRITAFSSSPDNNRSLKVQRLEIDIDQTGDMQVIVEGRKWARSAPIIKGPYTFTPNTEFVDNIFSQGRIMNFKFISNTLGGSYHFGKLTIDYLLGETVP